MKGYLLDTNIALFSMTTPDRVPPEVRRKLEAGLCYLSVISYWEVLLKSMKQKLSVGDPKAWWQESLENLGAKPLLFRPEHVSAMYGLPEIHNDPFDRALLGQAIAEELTIVTADAVICEYDAPCLRIR